MILIVILLLLSSPILLVTLLWSYYYYKSEKFVKNIPGPTPLPVIGNLHQLSPVEEALHVLFRFQQKYGNIFKMRTIFDRPTMFITDPYLIEEIFRSSNAMEKAVFYRFFHRWLGMGLITSSGEKWKMHRKMLTPAFHLKILEEFIDVFDKFGQILLDKLEAEVGKPSVDIFLPVSLCTLDIICASSMGTNVKAQKNSNSDYVISIKDMCRIFAERTSSLIKAVDFTYIFTKTYTKETKTLRLLHDFTNSIIASRKKELAKTDMVKDNEDDLGIKRRSTFLDTMLQYKEMENSISDEDIREEVNTFTFAGHDTTSAGISFLLYCLANHPDIQEKVVEELKSIFVDNDRPAKYQDFQEMKYLEMVLKESMRLYPPVPIFARQLKEDTKFDKYYFPKATELIIFAYGLHRDPNLFPDPEKFDPERFSPENQNSRPTYAYIPFSAGPRNCIGQRFSMIEIKSIVSNILRKFELLPAIPEFVPKTAGQIVLKSENGIRIRLKKRSI